MNVVNSSAQIEREPEFESEMLLDILFDEDGVVRKEKATIAHNLKEFVVGINPSSSALIVGNDGVSALTPDYPWLDLLGQWMDDGCAIEYLLVSASDSTVKLLTDLNKSHPKGSLKVSMPDRGGRNHGRRGHSCFLLCHQIVPFLVIRG